MDACVVRGEVICMERTDTEYVEQASVVEPATVARNLSRYDLVLGVIPIALLSGAAIGTVAPVSVEFFVGLAAVLCLPVLFDALYRNPPTQGRSRTRSGESTSRDDVDAIAGGDVDGGAR
jgi:hypothetical protein